MIFFPVDSPVTRGRMRYYKARCKIHYGECSTEQNDRSLVDGCARSLAVSLCVWVFHEFLQRHWFDEAVDLRGCLDVPLS